MKANDNSSAAQARTGTRVRQLRLALGLTQTELAEASGIAAGVISMVENDHHELDPLAVRALAEVLDCSPSMLSSSVGSVFDRPKLRAYADASQKAVDSTLFDSVTAVEAITSAGLRLITPGLPVYDGDLSDDDGIDRIAADVRTAAGIDADAVIPNVIRSVERLGCVVLPLDRELSPRHWGMSVTVNGVPVVRISRPSLDPDLDIPGDRQRFTVAHELGHLVLHSASPQPTSPGEAARMEREAHRFAAAFLVPGDAVLEDLSALGGRVTLGTLSRLKQKWGYSIKAFVVRFRELGVIDDAQARSLYKQISARKWNKHEPHQPGTETAVWLERAIKERFNTSNPVASASNSIGLGERYFERWLDWAPSRGVTIPLPVIALEVRTPSSKIEQSVSAQITRLPLRRG